MTDSRTVAERARCDRILFRLYGQLGNDALDESAADDRALADLVTLGDVWRIGGTLAVSAAGQASVAMLQVAEVAPRGPLTANHTATGATLFYWPDGFGKRRVRVGAWHASRQQLRFAPALESTGQALADAPTLAEAHDITADRLLALPLH